MLKGNSKSRSLNRERSTQLLNGLGLLAGRSSHRATLEELNEAAAA
jgi:hypothetical protein